MEWIKITPGCFEPYKDEDKYLILIYGECSAGLSCSFDLIFWRAKYQEWTNSEGYPTWTDKDLYEWHTHCLVIEKPED